MNVDTHKSVLVTILREIYADPLLRVALGFKGGTAAVLFYGLPRFSVDLDFDLLDSKKTEAVFLRLKELLPQFGEVKDASVKRHTLFFLLNYQKGERSLKVEISKRPSLSHYELKNYLGISVLVMKKEDMAAGKLSALLTRKRFAARDLFDLWFYFKNNWQINEKVLAEKTGLTLKQALKQTIEKVEKVKSTQLLQGLGELLEQKQKSWIKEKLKDELLFYLRLYSDS